MADAAEISDIHRRRAAAALLLASCTILLRKRANRRYWVSPLCEHRWREGDIIINNYLIITRNDMLI